MSLICTKQIVIHFAFSETGDSLIPQKSIFNILSIIWSFSFSALSQIPCPSSFSKRPNYTHTCWYSSRTTWRNIPKQTNHQTHRNTQDHIKRINVEQIRLIRNIDVIVVMINFWFSNVLCCLLQKAKMARPKRSHFSVGPSADKVCEKWADKRQTRYIPKSGQYWTYQLQKKLHQLRWYTTQENVWKS